MKQGLAKWACGHSNHTAPDHEGYALCLDCGAVYVARLTREIFMRQIEAMYKREGLR